MTLDREIDFLAEHRIELAVAWVRAELAAGGGGALERCEAMIDAVCRRAPAWRYAAETRVLVAARRAPDSIPSLLRDHVRAWGIRGALLMDLVSLRPMDSRSVANLEAIAARLYGEVIGRPWDVSLWKALRHLLPSAERVAWFGVVEAARRQQLPTPPTAPS